MKSTAGWGKLQHNKLIPKPGDQNKDKSDSMYRSFVGNTDLLNIPQTAFLCSRNVPASIILKSFDWAKEMRDLNRCVASGDHSPIEKDVFHFLLKGKQPLVLALARGMMRNVSPTLREALSNQRLLIVSPFDASVKRASEDTAVKRNSLMTDLAEEVVVVYASPGGNVEREAIGLIKIGKKVKTFDVAENSMLIAVGAETYSFTRCAL